MDPGTEKFVIISADTHCGADVLGYKPYLEKRYHDDFDGWAAAHKDAWADISNEWAAKGGVHTGEHQLGVASFDDSANWDSAKRVEQLEADGVVAEVLFPNTTPPFYPSGAITAGAPSYPPLDVREYELRFAGIRAHNRWVADFSRQWPGRRAGLTQIFLSDLDDTCAEIERAHEDGLKGVLLPPDNFTSLQSLYYPRLDRIWSLCEDLGIPVVRHGVLANEPATAESGIASTAVGIFESAYFAERGLISMILSGVFERHPKLRFVVTELGGAWVPGRLAALDAFCDDARRDGAVTNIFAAEAVKALAKKPSEYWASNCYVGTFFTKDDLDLREKIGVDNMMWGADYPHFEGTVPFTRFALHENFADLGVDETRKMLGTTAAEVYGFDLKVLQPIADAIGPTMDEICAPLKAEKLPRYPIDSACPTFGGWSALDAEPSYDRADATA